MSEKLFGDRIASVGVSMAAMLMLIAGCSGSDDDGAGASADSSACEPQEVDLSASTQEAPLTTARPPVADDALAGAIASSFCSPAWIITNPGGSEQTIEPRPVLEQDEGLCIGREIVDELGPTRARELAFDQWPWHLLGFALMNNSPAFPPGGPGSSIEPAASIDRSEAEAITRVFEDCSEQWKLLFMLSITEGADGISDSSAQCASEQLSDEDARSILIGEIDRAYDDPSQPDAESFGDLVQPLIAVFDDCLTAGELDGLDWN